MRIFYIALAAVSMTFAAAIEPAMAQPRPWCFRGGENSEGGGLLVCAYQTLEQCRASVAGGNEGCERNPALAWDRIEGKRSTQPSRQRPQR